jgi:hypothetical protein
MARRSRNPRWLFWPVCGLALSLVGLVLAGPFLDPGDPDETGWWQVVHLFATDSAVRRTSLASAMGMLVTACVFFQHGDRYRSANNPPRRPRRSNVAGA